MASQIARLQIEYASALYVAWQVLNTDDRESLRFRRLMTQPGLLLDDPLFANVLANLSVRRLSTNPNPYDAGDVFDWLLTYLRELYAHLETRKSDHRIFG
jgi:hypothetical protein